MQTFVMGDIHGAGKALLQCLQRCGFNYSRHRLIQLGDVADGFEDVFSCVEELLKIKHLVAIKGNHDDWFTQFILSGQHPKQWQQGGLATAASYLRLRGRANDVKQLVTGWQTTLMPADIPVAHQQFFIHQLPYFIDEHNNCFVHGGFNIALPFAAQEANTYFWNRQLWFDAVEAAAGGSTLVTPFNKVFVGHTNTLRWQTDQPMQAGNIYNLDTGAGHQGRLTIMNVTTGQYWQSDPVKTLYIP